jgi:hypothetical protein
VKAGVGVGAGGGATFFLKKLNMGGVVAGRAVLRAVRHPL